MREVVSGTTNITHCRGKNTGETARERGGTTVRKGFVFRVCEVTLIARCKSFEFPIWKFALLSSQVQKIWQKRSVLRGQKRVSSVICHCVLFVFGSLYFVL